MSEGKKDNIRGLCGELRAAMEEFKAGMKALQEHHKAGNHKAVGDSLEQFQFAADEIANTAGRMLESVEAAANLSTELLKVLEK